jgi:hypothetical protein
MEHAQACLHPRVRIGILKIRHILGKTRLAGHLVCMVTGSVVPAPPVCTLPNNDLVGVNATTGAPVTTIAEGRAKGIEAGSEQAMTSAKVNYQKILRQEQEG